MNWDAHSMKHNWTSYLQETAKPWHNVDLKASYSLPLGLKGGKGLSLSLEVRNLLNNKNGQIINPVTGSAYEYGDDVPTPGAIRVITARRKRVKIHAIRPVIWHRRKYFMV